MRTTHVLVHCVRVGACLGGGLVAAVRSYMYVLGSAVPPTKGHVSTHRADTDMSDGEGYGSSGEDEEHESARDVEADRVAQRAGGGGDGAAHQPDHEGRPASGADEGGDA